MKKKIFGVLKIIGGTFCIVWFGNIDFEDLWKVLTTMDFSFLEWVLFSGILLISVIILLGGISLIRKGFNDLEKN